MRSNLPTGTITFLFTDIEGSTRLWEKHPDEMKAALAKHDAILREAIESNGGHFIKTTGDGVHAVVEKAHDTISAMLTAQQRLLESLEGVEIKVRMGAHTGEAELRGDDYFGQVLNRAARLMSAGHGGQILISNATAELVREKLPENATLRDLGEHRLKDIVSRERIFQQSAPLLQSEFPPIKTLDSFPNNLPVQLTSFIGREKEIADVKRLLGMTHLLTLTGSGGTGKTRLSLQAAAELLPEFADGIWLVELAPLADPALVIQSIAAVLNVREQPGRYMLDQLVDFLRAKQLLLILDNCEHLLATCAETAERLLRACPRLKILASSREGLGIAGETTLHVSSLSLPDRQTSRLVQALRESEAVRLFVERAQAALPGFALTEQNAPAIAQICRRLDDRFRLLTGGSRTALPRQQTLRALVDWSYDLLTAPERAALRQLSVFVGGWTLSAAEMVVRIEPGPGDVLELLGQLVNKSLVVVEPAAEPETRYRLLETIQQYARERLLEADTGEGARDRHLAHYLQYAEAGELKLNSPHLVAWLDECELDHDNFRAALDWGLERDPEAALRLAGILHWFWTRRGYFNEGKAWLEIVLERVAALPEPQGESLRQRQAGQARALCGVSDVAIAQGDTETAVAAGEASLRLFQLLGDQAIQGFALAQLGFAACLRGDTTLAERSLNEAIRLGRATDHKPTWTYALGVYGRYLLLPRGDVAGAQAAFQEVFQLAQALGNLWVEGQVELGRSGLALQQGQWEGARSHGQAAVRIYGRIRDRQLTTVARSALAEVEAGLATWPKRRVFTKSVWWSGKNWVCSQPARASWSVWPSSPRPAAKLSAPPAFWARPRPCAKRAISLWRLTSARSTRAKWRPCVPS